MNRPVLEIDDLVVEARSSDKQVRIVDGVSFAVRAGRTLGLVGESGSGKSVTCLSLLGLPPRGVSVTGGRILFDGHDLRGRTPAELNALRGREIGMILQDPMTSLNPLLTIGRQITEMFRYRDGIKSREVREARAIDLLRQVRIPAPESRLNSYPHQFSGGMRQRVAIAMNLACNPRLLIADEPTTALDVTVRLQILDLLREVQAERGTAIVLVTHDLHLVRRYCDDVAVMYAGRIVEQGPVEQVFGRPRHPYTKGLLGAVPRLFSAQRRLTVIPGQPPLPGSIAQGCRFALRCPRAQADCLSAYPATRDIDTNRSVACWHPEPEEMAPQPLLATEAS
ncbi:oligopeptide/dipeptide ABC transporter, ATP-binding protein, C-terminal domain-containing protein [Caballeronia arationis]|jgi:oligopeptide/dipeptide ABC transporter ATP-binding protein|uniref:Oligopeptide/dipeptide ABC transporter, ATP-binding protein, C-terminal domain-containing protein n=1 Tax=Caballeronia arationis TaxID=1777142 RepID=A0A7Z7I3C6_9BURK|nr:ABC transporter ATP-binding protein [Caballeronia arationis]SOE56227.1 oligopeptide/dipeptide ABC transporter, ATP-binding protein, C-terminal domain-containing protein [Caballeronia arationis]